MLPWSFKLLFIDLKAYSSSSFIKPFFPLRWRIHMVMLQDCRLHTFVLKLPLIPLSYKLLLGLPLQQMALLFQSFFMLQLLLLFRGLLLKVTLILSKSLRLVLRWLLGQRIWHVLFFTFAKAIDVWKWEFFFLMRYFRIPRQFRCIFSWLWL